MKCKHCKTGAYMIRKTVEVKPHVLQTYYHCNNCGRRYKEGRPYRVRRPRLISKYKEYGTDYTLQKQEDP